MTRSIEFESGSNVVDEKQRAFVEELEEPAHACRPRGYRPVTAEERALDKSLNLKLDCIVVVICAINFLLQGVDKSNIGNAATTSTFQADANLGPNDVPNSISLLSATFVTLQPISTMLARRFGAKYWIQFLMASWGSVSMAHAAIKNTSTLYALRLLLGAFEAGFVPSVFYYLGTLYPHYMLGFRLGLFAGMYSIAGAFSGLIAYGVFQITSSQFRDWQLLFLIEGGVTILMAIVSVIALPDKLETAWFLNQSERTHALHRLQIDNPIYDSDGNLIKDTHKVTLCDVKDAILDWKKLLTVCCNITATLPVYVFGVFMPLIVRGMGFTATLQANLMSVSPFIVGAIGLFIFVWLSDRYHERSLLICASLFISLIGFIVLTVSQNNVLRYVFVHVCLAGAGNTGPLMAAWLTDNSPEMGTRSVIIGINGYSNLAGVIAGQLFKAQYAPTYQYPLTVTMILVCIGLAGFACMRVVFMITNRRRAKTIAGWTADQIEEERLNVKRRGHQKLTFIYGY